MYFYGYFLINFSIPPRQPNAITWENFVPAKRDTDCTQEGPHLDGIKRFTCNRRTQFTKSL